MHNKEARKFIVCVWGRGLRFGKEVVCWMSVDEGYGCWDRLHGFIWW